MNDWKTRDIAAHVLEEMGYNKLSESVKKEQSNIDVYIRYIKYRVKKYKELNELVTYFL